MSNTAGCQYVLEQIVSEKSLYFSLLSEFFNMLTNPFFYVLLFQMFFQFVFNLLVGDF